MGELASRRIGYSPGMTMGDTAQSVQERSPQEKDGAKSEEDRKAFVDQVHEWFRDSATATDPWRLDAVEDYEFVSGHQWRDADRKARGKRSVITVNKILGKVLLLAGLQRQQRSEPTLIPATGGSSPMSAEFMNALLKWVGKQCRERVIDSTVFLDKIITGLAYWKIILDYDVDPEGRPAWERVHPLSIFADPNWFDQGWEHGDYCLHATWKTMRQAIDTWPDYEEQIRAQYGEWLNETSSRMGQNAGTAEGAGDSFSSERMFWDPATQRIRVLEAWYRRRLRVQVARNNISGETNGDPEFVQSMQQRLQRAPQAQSDFSFFERPVTTVRVCNVLNSLLLSDDPSPFDAPQFPIFPTLGYYFWRHPFGIVKPLKDPQREKNYRRSTITDMVSRLPLSGFFNPESGGAKTEDIERFAGGNGVTIPYKDKEPSRIDPPELPQSIVYLEQAADKDMDDLLSTRTLTPATPGYTTSARHVESLQRPAIITQEPLLESFRLDKEPAVQFMVKAIQQYMPVGKALRILGSLAQREQQTRGVGPDGQPLPLSPMTQAMNDPSTNVTQVLQDALLADYDTVVDSTKPWEPTVQLSMFNTLRELAQEFPGSIPPEVLVERGKDAGLVNEDDAGKILAWVQQQMQAQQAGGTPPGRPPRRR